MIDNDYVESDILGTEKKYKKFKKISCIVLKFEIFTF